MTIRKVFIKSNPARDHGGTGAARVSELLASRGITVTETLDSADIVISLGGDGTLLGVASDAARCAVPVLGINLGNIGFMTAFDADKIELLSNVLDGEYVLDTRMMLEAETELGEKFLALNDAVLTGEPGRTLEVTLAVDGSTAAKIRGDGMVASTPTGSTAYSMSAGGPITDPRADCVVLTPICAHTPYARPFVIPASSITIIKCAEKAALTVDGVTCAQIEQGGSVCVRKAAQRLSLVRLKNYDFYGIMGKKLWNA